MCVIISGRENKPTLVELQAAERQNPDGGSLSWCTADGVVFRKGLTAEAIHKDLSALTGDTRWTVHFRYATVGGTNDGLCHPFPISSDTPLDAEGTADRVLFHNGTVHDWQERLADVALDPKFKIQVPAGEWSDSRAIAWLLALNKSTRGLRFIEGKFIVMNSKGIKIYPESGEGWTLRNGISYSNTFWMKRIPQVVSEMHPKNKQSVLSFLEDAKKDHSGTPSSLVDEAQALLDKAEEAEAMDLPKPKKKKKAKKKIVRKGLKISQDK